MAIGSSNEDVCSVIYANGCSSVMFAYNSLTLCVRSHENIHEKKYGFARVGRRLTNDVTTVRIRINCTTCKRCNHRGMLGRSWCNHKTIHFNAQPERKALEVSVLTQVQVGRTAIHRNAFVKRIFGCVFEYYFSIVVLNITVGFPCFLKRTVYLQTIGVTIYASRINMLIFLRMAMNSRICSHEAVVWSFVVLFGVVMVWSREWCSVVTVVLCRQWCKIDCCVV